MKRSLALLSMMLLIGTVTVTATSAEEPQRIHGGFLGGLSVTDITWSPAPDFGVSNRARAAFGGFLAVSLAPSVSLETRALWVQTAIHASASSEEGFDAARISVDYLSVPVLFRRRFDDTRLRPFLVAGPEIAFKIRTRSSLEVGGIKVEDAGLADDVSSTNFSLDVGGGIDIPTKAFDVFVEGLYSHGLATIDGSRVDPDDVKTRSFRFNVGIRF